MVGLAFAVAATANFPALLLALTWRRFNTDGRADRRAVIGVISSIGLVIISPSVWPGPDTEGAPVVLDADQPGHRLDPARASSAATWARCCRTERGAERSFHELYVRSETGLGAEKAARHHGERMNYDDACPGTTVGGPGALQHRRRRLRQAPARQARDGPRAPRRQRPRGRLGRAAGHAPTGSRARAARRRRASAATASRCCCRRRRRRPPSFFGDVEGRARILLSMSVLYGDDGIRHRARRLAGAKVLVTDARQPRRASSRLADVMRARRRALDERRRPTFETRRHRRRRPGAALLHVRHDRAGQGHPARPPLHPRATRSSSYCHDVQDGERFHGMGEWAWAAGHRAAARARGGSARSRSSCSARAASTRTSSSTFLSRHERHERLHDADGDPLDDGHRATPARATRSTSAVVCSAGEPLNPEAIRWFREQYGVTVLDYYGLTESYPLVANFPFMEVREGSMGRPMPGWDVQILDEDEQPVAQRRARRDLPARALEPALSARLLEQRRGRRGGRSAASGSTPRTPPRWTRTATSGTRAAPTT